MEKYDTFFSSAYNVIEYRQQRDTSEEKSLKNRLDDRMAISCLQMISNPDYKFVAVSLHNINSKSSESYAYILILDFLEKLEMPVVIAGDFNCDITEGAKAAGYLIDDYKLDPLRDQPKRGRIDFIAVRPLKSSSFNFMNGTTAHPVGDSSAKKVVGDSPVKKEEGSSSVKKEAGDGSVKKEEGSGSVKKEVGSDSSIKEVTNHNPLTATIPLICMMNT